MNTLQYRLEHCLQSLLALQPSLRRVYRRSLAEDFSILANYLGRIEQLNLTEEDVSKLEYMTREFIRAARFSTAPPMPVKEAH